MLEVEKAMLHAVRTATVAKAIAKHEQRDKQTVENVFLAGMLHDVGSLVLAAELPHKWAELVARKAMPDASAISAERDVFGVSHALVGAYLLGLWALPDSIVEAVAYHEEPGACAAGDWGTFGIVHVASCLATQLDCEDVTEVRGLDRDYLRRVGVLDRWPEWRAVAAAALHEEGTST